ncbi:MAG: hypothetical protein ACXWCZ_07510, partial [Flavisolibacter sp.]
AEGELGGDGKSMLAKIIGSNYYRALPDKDCKLRWYLFEPYTKYMNFNLEKAEMNMGVDAKYTGTREYQSPPADILLGFCDKPARDTLLMQTFLPNGQESWLVDGQTTTGNFVQSIMMSCFMDEKRVREAAGNKAKYEKMRKEMMADYQNAIAGNEHLMGKDPATMTKDEREKMQKIVAATNAIQNKLTASAVMSNVIFNESLKNNLKTVFESEVNGRVLFPRNTSIKHAIFKVQIVHVEE